MPSDAILKAMNGAHRVLMKVSGGRIGWSAMSMPVVELTTTGAKSGQRRSTMLSTPLVDGEVVVLVASFGGDDRNPAWFHNVQAHPEVEITMDGATRPMVARVAGPDERDRLWEQITTAHSNYAGYQKRTERVIPVVVLEPPA